MVCVYSDVLILYIVSLTSLGLLSYLYHFPISLLHASNTLLLMQCLAMLFFFFFPAVFTCAAFGISNTTFHFSGRCLDKSPFITLVRQACLYFVRTVRSLSGADK